MVHHPRQAVSVYYRQHQAAQAYGAVPEPGLTAVGQQSLGAVPLPATTASPNPRKMVMAGGSALALAALLVTPHLGDDQAQTVASDACIKLEQAQNPVSRDRLRQLLAIQAGAPKAAVRTVLSEPHCVLPPTSGQQGGQTERQAYPLEFDPSTWLVVLYENDRYSGYDFSFRR